MPSVSNGKLQAVEQETGDYPAIHDIYIKGSFDIDIDVVLRDKESKLDSYYVVVSISVTPHTIPRFVGDEVFPDWLVYESYGITERQVLEFTDKL